MAIKKTALDDVLGTVGNAITGFAQGLKNTFQNTFSRDYNNFSKPVQFTPTQFSSGLANTTRSILSSAPQFAAQTLFPTQTAALKLGSGLNQQLGNPLGKTGNFISTKVLKPLASDEFLAATQGFGRNTPAGFLGSKGADIIGSGLAKLGISQFQNPSRNIKITPSVQQAYQTGANLGKQGTAQAILTGVSGGLGALAMPTLATAGTQLAAFGPKAALQYAAQIGVPEIAKDLGVWALKNVAASTAKNAYLQAVGENPNITPIEFARKVANDSIFNMMGTAVANLGGGIFAGAKLFQNVPILNTLQKSIRLPLIQKWSQEEFEPQVARIFSGFNPSQPINNPAYAQFTQNFLQRLSQIPGQNLATATQFLREFPVSPSSFIGGALESGAGATQTALALPRALAPSVTQAVSQVPGLLGTGVNAIRSGVSQLGAGVSQLALPTPQVPQVPMLNPPTPQIGNPNQQIVVNTNGTPTVNPTQPTTQIPQELEPLVAKAKTMTKDNFVQLFNDGLNSQNLTTKETAQNVLSVLQQNGLTPETFFDQATAPTAPQGINVAGVQLPAEHPVSIIAEDMKQALSTPPTTPEMVNAGATETGPVTVTQEGVTLPTAAGSLLSDKEIAFVNGAPAKGNVPLNHSKDYDLLLSTVNMKGATTPNEAMKNALAVALEKYSTTIGNKEEYTNLIKQLISSGAVTETTAVRQLAEGFTQFLQGQNPFGGLANDYYKGVVQEVQNLASRESSSAMISGGTVPPETPVSTEAQAGLTAGQKERGVISTVKANETIDDQVRNAVSGTYDMTSDKGRLDYGKEYIKTNYPRAIQRALSDEAPTPELSGITMAIWQDAMERGDAGLQTQIIDHIAARATPMGQYTQMLHLFANSSPQGMVEWAKGLYEEANKFGALSPVRLGKKLLGKDYKLEMTPEEESYIKNRMAEINKLPEGTDKFKAVHELMNSVTDKIPPSVMQYSTAYRYNNILSNPRTQMRNIYQNIVQTYLTRPLTLTATGAIGDFRQNFLGQEAPAHLSDAAKYVMGTFEGYRQGLQGFADAVSGKEDILTHPDLQGNIMKFTGKNIPPILQTSGRLLEGADRFFSAILASGEKAVNLSHGMNEEEATKKAAETAAQYLFRSPLDPQGRSGQGKVLQAFDNVADFIIKGRNKLPFGNWFIPFIRVPMAVAKMGVEYNPLFGWSTAIGAQNKDEQIGKWLIGSMVAGIGAVYAAENKTTWTAPSDPQAKAAFYAEGKRPYSVKIGNTWVPMTTLGVLGQSLALPAAMKYYFQDSPTALTDSDLVKVAGVLTGQMKQVADSTPLTGLQDWINLVSGNTDYTTAGNLGFTASQILPESGLVSWVNSILDPVIRKSDSFMASFGRGIPGFPQKGTPVLEPTGEPARKNITDIISPYTFGLPKPGAETFAQLGEARINLLQQNALTKQMNDKVDTAVGSGAGQNVTLGTGGTGTGTGATNKKQLDAMKKVVTDRLDLYNSTSDPTLQDQIRKSIESLGVDFDTARKWSLSQGLEPTQQGLTPDAEAKLLRSNQFTMARKARDTYSAIDPQFVDKQLQDFGITPGDLAYDDQTALPEDIKLDQIHGLIAGTTGTNLINTLSAMRKVSEGSRKPLLTDSIIGKLNDEGVINDNTASALKRLQYDLTTKSFSMSPAKGKKPTKLSVSVPKTKVITPKLGGGRRSITPLKTLKTSARAKIKAPPRVTLAQPTLKVAKKVGAFRAPVTSIRGLGRV